MLRPASIFRRTARPRRRQSRRGAGAPRRCPADPRRRGPARRRPAEHPRPPARPAGRHLLAGRAATPSPLAQNCSGKHAAMLATCRVAGWDTAAYLDPGHPLQRAVRETVEKTSPAFPWHGSPWTAAAPRCSPAPGRSRPGLRADRDRAARHPGRAGGDGPAQPPVVGRGHGSGRRPAHRRGARPDRQGRGGGRVRSGAAGRARGGAQGPRRRGPAGAGGGGGDAEGAGRRRAGLAEAGHTAVLGHGVPVGRVEPVLGTASGPSAV